MNIKDTLLFTKPIAHRGLHNEELPENSIAAFENAAAHGFPIELDVRIIDDGTLIVFHDDKLSRMTSLDGYVSNLKEADLENVFLNGSKQKIPTLHSVLEAVNGKVPLLIEIKNSGSVGILESKLLEQLKKYTGEFAIQSFNPYSVGYFAQNAPDILRGQLSTYFERKDVSFIKGYILKRLRMNRISKPDFIAYDCRYLPNPYVNRAKLPVLAWTVRSNSEYFKVKEFCNNIIFEGFNPQE